MNGTPMENLGASLRRTGRIGLALAAVGSALCILGAILDLPQFFHSYLFALIFWTGMSMGCLGILLINHLMGGAWGVVLRRVLEAGALTMPLIALLFVPILLGLKDVYLWARPEEISRSPALLHKSLYLAPWFYILRTAFYLGSWSALAWYYRRNSLLQDSTGDSTPPRRMERAAGPALLFFIVTATFAAIDWLMSLEPLWYSTIYGIMVLSGQTMGAMALAIIVASFLAGESPVLAAAFNARRFHDFATLLFTFVLFWAYLCYSQLIVIWYGNKQDEITWYLRRIEGTWAIVASAIFVFAFVIPFPLMLSRLVKRNSRFLKIIGAIILAARLLDTYWLIAPAFHDGGFSIHWLDIVAPLAVGGLWIAAFTWLLSSRPILPLHVPGFEVEPAEAGTALEAA